MKNEIKITGVAFLIVIAIIGFLGAGYVKNIIKFVSLDFKEPYKAEVIRGIGLIPVVGMIVGWVDIQDK